MSILETINTQQKCYQMDFFQHFSCCYFATPCSPNYTQTEREREREIIREHSCRARAEERQNRTKVGWKELKCMCACVRWQIRANEMETVGKCSRENER